METSAIRDRIVAELDSMNEHELDQVLKLMTSGLQFRGRGLTAGELLAKYGGSIPDDELDRMDKAIEEGCERIEPD